MSEADDEPFARVIQAHMRGFLRSTVTGCAFAAAHAPEASDALYDAVHVGPLDEDLPTDIESALDTAAEARAAAVVVFPELRTAPDICSLLALLHGRERWRMERVPWKTHARPDALVGLWWRTAAGNHTSVMGLAPLGSMPATRRAPYVALVAWTGRHENEHWTKRTRGEVGLVDMRLPPSLTEPDKYRTAFKRTRDEVKAIEAALAEGAAEPNVAFCLPAEYQDRLAHMAAWPT
ncbi:MAG: hypothetical protein KF729_34465 [Sandaracinaceae bacterium]|nr:hypothetical protein [Sandaracinaceae bacterium]